MKNLPALIALITVLCHPEGTSAQVINLGGATTRAVVGISDYQDPGIPDLRYADRDAEAFANYLCSPAGDHLKVLTNQNATAKRLKIPACIGQECPHPQAANSSTDFLHALRMQKISNRSSCVATKTSLTAYLSPSRITKNQFRPMT